MLRGVLTVRRLMMRAATTLPTVGCHSSTTGDPCLETAEETARYAAAFGKLSAAALEPDDFEWVHS